MNPVHRALIDIWLHQFQRPFEKGGNHTVEPVCPVFVERGSLRGKPPIALTPLAATAARCPPARRVRRGEEGKPLVGASPTAPNRGI